MQRQPLVISIAAAAVSRRICAREFGAEMEALFLADLQRARGLGKVARLVRARSAT